MRCEIDKNRDMLQIGRSAETQVDFIVMDTIPGEETISEKFASRSTISRFACRVLVDRNPPHTVRIFAAAFDAKNSIQIGVSRSIFFMNKSRPSTRQLLPPTETDKEMTYFKPRIIIGVVPEEMKQSLPSENASLRREKLQVCGGSKISVDK